MWSALVCACALVCVYENQIFGISSARFGNSQAVLEPAHPFLRCPSGSCKMATNQFSPSEPGQPPCAARPRFAPRFWALTWAQGRDLPYGVPGKPGFGWPGCIYHTLSSPFLPPRNPRTPFVCCLCTPCTYTLVFQKIFCSPPVRP